MDLRLNNKVALVTGSSRGIGKSIATSLLEEGCKIILNGKNTKLLKNTSKILGNSTSYIVADVTKSSDCSKMIKKIIHDYGRLDILVCNVGDGTSALPGKENSKDWQTKIIEIRYDS